MIQREELEQILNFVSSRWSEVAKEKDSKVMENLPNDFWMNSVGGKTANGGFWVTTLMYTENEADAAAIPMAIDFFSGGAVFPIIETIVDIPPAPKPIPVTIPKL